METSIRRTVWLAGSFGACPNCPTAADVRSSVFDAGLWPEIAVLLLPLLLIVLIAAGLHRMMEAR